MSQSRRSRLPAAVVQLSSSEKSVGDSAPESVAVISRFRRAAGSSATNSLAVSTIISRTCASDDCCVALAYTSSLWLALVIWGLGEGFGVLFNINTASLRQAVVPNHMLGRIISIAMVLAWSAQPLGALAGGFLIERTGDVRLIYAVIGAVTFLIALVFRVASPLGRAERYLAPASAAAE